MESWDELFGDRLSFGLGNGLKASFWVDPWAEGRCPLMDMFLSLFELSVQKRDSVESMWDSESKLLVFRFFVGTES